jgi:GT2 family glycosyltransferase/glycosyltransferase involved in cell wall biosynthesis
MASEADVLSSEGATAYPGGPTAELNPLDHPIIFATPRRLTSGSAWHQHIPLGMLLVDLARPATVVELGTRAGDSYCAFCQAIDQLGLEASAYAVNTWEGDSDRGHHRPDVLAGLRAHHDPLYGTFSQLVQSSFADALSHFEDGGIDLLHIDGCHVDEAVRADLEAWLPKLSSRGLVLLHDTDARGRGSSVDRLWSELRERYPHYEVQHGHGLGALQVGREGRALEPLIAMGAERDRAFRRLVLALGQGLFEQAQADRDLVADDRSGPRELREELAAVHQELGRARGALEWERAMSAERELEHARRLAEEAARAEQLSKDLWGWFKLAEGHLGDVDRLLQSRSWRVTAPLRAPGRLLRRRRKAETPTFPGVDSPQASIIIPVHSNPGPTASCLASIAGHTPALYEVVLADDRSDRKTRRLLQSVGGARLLVNEENLGFIRTVNRAAAECESPYLVICNNDIEVRPGWLSAMIECAESAPDIAVVVPKFLRSDGTVREAGGIVWSDGGAFSYGAGNDPGDSRTSFRREVDYGSAAAMLVRTDFWRAVGGFDEGFSPAYYEDIDLCFAARERGLRVVYEPTAEVVHHEGSSHGTDEDAGLKSYQRINAPKFAEKWRDALDSQPGPTESAAGIRAAANRAPGPRVLVVDHTVPTPDRDAGSARMLNIVRALIDLGCQVRFVPENNFRWEPYSGRLERLGVEVIYGRGDLREEFTQIGPELGLVLTSRPVPSARFLPMVRDLAPQATVAYDTVDLHYVRERRRAEVEGVTEPPVVETLRSLELAMVSATDATICVSEAEADTVKAEVPDARVELIPTVHELSSEVPPAEGREGVVFVGGFSHTPNLDAARFLAQEVMPLVWRRAPETVLRIVGDLGTERLADLAGERVVIEGWIEDLDGLLDRTRAMAAPMRYGAGVKGKITHSLARGLPVVTTTVGIEGLDATAGRDLLVADDAAGLAAELVRLLRDDELWGTLSEGGLALASRRFSTGRIAEVLRSLLPA